MRSARTRARAGRATLIWLACLLSACGDPPQPEPEVGGRTRSDWQAALKSEQGGERASALKALVGFEESALPLIAPHLEAEVFEVRLAAIRAVGSLGPTAAAHVDTLAVYLKSDAAGFDAKQQKALRDAAMLSLGAIGPAALKPIAHLLASRDSKLRARAVFTIRPFVGELPDGTNMLLPLLEDESWVVRREACRCLGVAGKGDERASLALLEALKDENADVVRHAAMALGGIGGRSDREGSALAELLYAHQTQIRAAAAYGLGLMGEEASPYLDRVADLLNNDAKRYVRIHAARAHWEISGDATEALAELKKDIRCRDPRMCLLALRAVTAMGPDAKEAVPRLIELLDKPDLRRAAVAALSAMGSAAKPALPALEALGKRLGEKDATLAKELQEAVQAIRT